MFKSIVMFKGGLKIGARLRLCFGGFVLVIFCTNLYIFLTAQNVGALAGSLTAYRMASIDSIGDLRSSSSIMHNQLLAYRLDRQVSRVETYQKAKAALIESSGQLDRLSAYWKRDQQAIWSDASADVKGLLDAGQRLFDATSSLDDDQWRRQYNEDFLPHLFKLINKIAGEKREIINEDGISGFLQKDVHDEAFAIHSDIEDLRKVIAALLIFSLLYALGAATKIGRSFVQPLLRMQQAMVEIAHGDSDVQITDQGRTDELGDMARALSAIRDVGVESERMRRALDSCSATIMVVDLNNKIIFINQAMLSLIDKHTDELWCGRLVKRPAELLGQPIDSFCTEIMVQLRIHAEATSLQRVRCQTGLRLFDCVLAPTVDRNNNRVSTVIEWIDVTYQLQAEHEIAAIVTAAAQGDLSARLTLEQREGLMLTLGIGINRLLSIAATFIDELGGFFAAVAAGDLTARVTGTYEGRFGRLSDDANRSAAQLDSVIGRIIATAQQVAAASREIAAGSGDLSHRTEQQAASLEEAAASMEEMAATVRHNSDNAQLANTIAQKTRQAAERGSLVAVEAVTAMEQIEISARQITDIISVMDEITFQTNLQALNAAVEAARAGEVGRGFAVVATEVRALSLRSAAAAKDIKSLIRESHAQISTGVESVNRAGAVLNEIAASSTEVAGLIAEIASASGEQATGLDLINHSVARIDDMTQGNSALVEESATSAQALDEQSVQMLEMTGFFHFSDSAQTSPTKTTFGACSKTC